MTWQAHKGLDGWVLVGCTPMTTTWPRDGCAAMPPGSGRSDPGAAVPSAAGCPAEASSAAGADCGATGLARSSMHVSICATMRRSISRCADSRFPAIASISSVQRQVVAASIDAFINRCLTIHKTKRRALLQHCFSMRRMQRCPCRHARLTDEYDAGGGVHGLLEELPHLCLRLACREPKSPACWGRPSAVDTASAAIALSDSVFFVPRGLAQQQLLLVCAKELEETTHGSNWQFSLAHSMHAIVT